MTDRISVLPLHRFIEGRSEVLSADVRTCAHLVMSALPPKADIRPRDQDVCFGPIGDITTSHYRAAYQVLCCNRSGNIAMFAAIRRASSFVSNFAAERRPGLFS